MTTTTQPATVSLTVLGPNGITEGGSFHVHAAGCRDIVKSRYRAARGNMWTEDFSSADDVTGTIYPPKDFDYNWDDPTQRGFYSGDIVIFDCVTFPQPGAMVTVDEPDPIRTESLDVVRPNVQDAAMTTTKKQTTKSDPGETHECDVCHLGLPTQKFPTVHRKDGIHRGTECRACRDYRLAGRAIGRPEHVVRPGAEPTKPAKAGYRGGAQVAAVPSVDVAA